MNTVTTHVLDTSRGRPADGVPVTLEVEVVGGWELVGKGTTDEIGRVANLVPSKLKIFPGVYRLMFDTSRYFAAHNIEGFYPLITVVFTVRDPAQHYHVPLLLSPFGYSTYRGS